MKHAENNTIWSKIKEKLHKYSFFGCLLLVGALFLTWTDNWKIYAEPLRQMYEQGTELLQGQQPALEGGPEVSVTGEEIVNDTPVPAEEEEPEEDETPDSEEAIRAEEDAFYQSMSAEDLHQLLLNMDDVHASELWERLSEGKRREIADYQLLLAFGEEPEVLSCIVKEGGAASDMTAAAGLVAGVLSSSPVLRSPARSLLSGRRTIGTALESEAVEVSDGLVMSKSIRKNDADESHTDYTIRLEAYATRSEERRVGKECRL